MYTLMGVCNEILPSIFLDSKPSMSMINRFKLFSNPAAMRYSKLKNDTAELIRLHGADM